MADIATEHSRIRFFGPGFAAGGGIPPLDDVGGKGINLCKLTAAQFPVPPGFVVTTGAYRQFVADNGLLESIRTLAGSIDGNDVKGLESISAQIRALFAENPIPAALEEEILGGYRKLRDACGESVAVRSSATAEDLPEATFAGQQDTYLNISGEAAMLKAVKSCWGSLWTARAIAYRAKQGTALEGLAMAVIVQQMAHAEAAGVMFTANPVTGADDIVINAAWGLGESIVGGNVTPDYIVADKATGNVKSITVSDKTVMTAATGTGTEEVEVDARRRNARVLDDDAVRRLVEFGCRIEQHYGAPQDIEWAVIPGGRFAMLQSRPIRGLEVIRDVEAGRQDEIRRLRALAGNTRRAWVTHNLGETLPAPTPLTWDIVSHFMSGNGGFGRLYKDLGYHPSKTVCEQGFLELICGRIYADPGRAAQLFWDGIPLEYNLDEVLKNKNILESAPGEFNAALAGPDFLLKLPMFVFSSIRSWRLTGRIRRTVLEDFERRALPPYLDYIREKRNQDMAHLSTAEVIAELDDRIARVMDDFGRESLKPGFFGGLALGALEGILAQLLGQEEGAHLARTLTMGIAGDITVEQNIMLYRVARGGVPLGSFIEKFGHRCIGEMELAEPRWREDSVYLGQSLEFLKAPSVKSPGESHQEKAAERKAAEERLPQILKDAGGSSFLEEVREHMAEAQKLLPYRENGKYYLMMGYEVIQLAILELASRWNLGRDIFFLHRGELPAFEADRESILRLIPQRKLRWQSLRTLYLPDVVSSGKLDMLGVPEKFESASEIKADPIASGISMGPAAIVFDPRQSGDIGTGYILVCPSTDPGWTALFINAKGLIVEKGGALSHGAIVARDFGIPAVVCPGATRRLKNGQQIQVDGNRGSISVIEAT